MSNTVSSLGSSQVSSQIATVQARLQKPITQLQNQAVADNAEITAWGAIKGTIASLSSALVGISDLSTINTRSATSASNTVATATATDSAQLATYHLGGITLAKSQAIYSAAQGSAAAKVGSSAGSLTFTLKNGKTEQVPVGSSDLTLNGIAQAINQVGGAVQASVIGTSTGARLVLQGSATGSSQAFSVAGTGTLAKFDYASGAATSGTFTRSQAASDAALTLNGVPITSKTNSISSAISGVAISLAASGSTTVTVGSSPGAIANGLSSVATNLNAAIAAIAKQTAYVPAVASGSAAASSAKAGPLLGNYTASDISSQLLTAITGAAASGATSNGIGLTVSSTGAVSFDSAAFAKAYATNPTGVSALVSQIYKSLNTTATTAIGSAGTTGTGTSTGTIAAQTQSFQAEIKSLNTEATQINKNNNSALQILESQYSAAEAASTAAATTQAYLSLLTSSSATTSKG